MPAFYPNAKLLQAPLPSGPGIQPRDLKRLWRQSRPILHQAAPDLASAAPRRLLPWTRRRCAQIAFEAARRWSRVDGLSYEAVSLLALSGLLGHERGAGAVCALLVRFARDAGLDALDLSLAPGLPETPRNLMRLALAWWPANEPEWSRITRAEAMALPPAQEADYLMTMIASLTVTAEYAYLTDLLGSDLEGRVCDPLAHHTDADADTDVDADTATGGSARQVTDSRTAGRSGWEDELPLDTLDDDLDPDVIYEAEPFPDDEIPIADVDEPAGDRARRHRAKRSETEGRPSIGGEPGAAGATQDTRGPTRVVVSEITQTDNDTGAEVLSEFAALEGPLPLAGTGFCPERIGRLVLAEFPWMSSVAREITASLRLQTLAGASWVRIEPMLLVGPPGCGKTQLAKRLAAIAGVPFASFAAGGQSTSVGFDATPRGYRSRHPAFPLAAIHRSGVANPILLVDEIDKASQDSPNGSVQDTLLGMVEAPVGMGWYDSCLMSNCDLSQISWLLTANDRDRVSAPLLSRTRVLPVGMPKREHAPHVLASMERDLATQIDWPAGHALPIDGDVRARLTDALAAGRPLRDVRRALRAAASHIPADQRPVQ